MENKAADKKQVVKNVNGSAGKTNDRRVSHTQDFSILSVSNLQQEFTYSFNVVGGGDRYIGGCFNNEKDHCGPGMWKTHFLQNPNSGP